jgi:ammonium transporter, Amt family
MTIRISGFGFNSGSAVLLDKCPSPGAVAGRIAVNTALSGGAGGITALLTNLYLEERKTGDFCFDLRITMNGCLSGLVAINSGCATVYSWAALLIGVMSSWIYIAASKFLTRVRIDDAVDAIPVHLFNGIWGVIATGLFSAPALLLDAFGISQASGVFYSIGQGSVDFTLLGLQMLAVLFVGGWTLFMMIPFFVGLNYMGWLQDDTQGEKINIEAHKGPVLDTEQNVLIATKPTSSRALHADGQ